MASYGFDVVGRHYNQFTIEYLSWANTYVLGQYYLGCHTGAYA
jgi:hypothetical protein